MEIAVTILVIIGAVLVTALVFGGWIVVAFVRLIARAIGSGARTNLTNPLPMPVARRARCGRANCRADNPGQARFCRRCGRMLHVAHPAAPAPVRRVAMW